MKWFTAQATYRLSNGTKKEVRACVHAYNITDAFKQANAVCDHALLLQAPDQKTKPVREGNAGIMFNH